MMKLSVLPLFLSSFLYAVSFSTFAMSGSGTPQDPYRVTNCTDLQNMQQNLSASYVLANDIDCTDTKNWSNGQGFMPVGTFTGTLDGQNYVISNLFINRPSQSSVGLLGATFGAPTISNVKLFGINVTGGSGVGGLIGAMTPGNANISNCDVAGSVSGNMTVGGLIGNASGNITKSHAEGSVRSIHGSVGGLIGSASLICNVSNSYATNHVSGGATAGGLIGYDGGGNVTSSYATGSVSGGSGSVGGLIGSINGSSYVSKSYATGNVSGNIASAAGRLIGSINNGGESIHVADNYATGSVSGGRFADRLIGTAK